MRVVELADPGRDLAPVGLEAVIGLLQGGAHLLLGLQLRGVDLGASAVHVAEGAVIRSDLVQSREGGLVPALLDVEEGLAGLEDRGEAGEGGDLAAVGLLRGLRGPSRSGVGIVLGGVVYGVGEGLGHPIEESLGRRDLVLQGVLGGVDDAVGEEEARHGIVAGSRVRSLGRGGHQALGSLQRQQRDLLLVGDRDGRLGAGGHGAARAQAHVDVARGRGGRAADALQLVGQAPQAPVVHQGLDPGHAGLVCGHARGQEVGLQVVLTLGKGLDLAQDVVDLRGLGVDIGRALGPLRRVLRDLARQAVGHGLAVHDLGARVVGVLAVGHLGLVLLDPFVVAAGVVVAVEVVLQRLAEVRDGGVGRGLVALRGAVGRHGPGQGVLIEVADGVHQRPLGVEEGEKVPVGLGRIDGALLIGDHGLLEHDLGVAQGGHDFDLQQRDLAVDEGLAVAAVGHVGAVGVHIGEDRVEHGHDLGELVLGRGQGGARGLVDRLDGGVRLRPLDDVVRGVGDELGDGDQVHLGHEDVGIAPGREMHGAQLVAVARDGGAQVVDRAAREQGDVGAGHGVDLGGHGVDLGQVLRRLALRLGERGRLLGPPAGQGLRGGVAELVDRGPRIVGVEVPGDRAQILLILGALGLPIDLAVGQDLHDLRLAGVGDVDVGARNRDDGLAGELHGHGLQLRDAVLGLLEVVADLGQIVLQPLQAEGVRVAGVAVGAPSRHLGQQIDASLVFLRGVARSAPVLSVDARDERGRVVVVGLEAGRGQGGLALIGHDAGLGRIVAVDRLLEVRAPLRDLVLHVRGLAGPLRVSGLGRADLGQLLVEQVHHLLDGGLGRGDLVEGEGQIHHRGQAREVLVELQHLLAAAAVAQGQVAGLVGHGQQALGRVAVGHLALGLAAQLLDVAHQTGDLGQRRLIQTPPRSVAGPHRPVLSDGGQVLGQRLEGRLLDRQVRHHGVLTLRRRQQDGVVVVLELLELAQAGQILGLGVLEIVELGELGLDVLLIALSGELAQEPIVFGLLLGADRPALPLEVRDAAVGGQELGVEPSHMVLDRDDLLLEVPGLPGQFLDARRHGLGTLLVELGVELILGRVGSVGGGAHRGLGRDPGQGRVLGRVVEDAREALDGMHGPLRELDARGVLQLDEQDVAPGDGAAEGDGALALGPLHGRADALEDLEVMSAQAHEGRVEEPVHRARVAHDAFDLRAHRDHAQEGLEIGAPEGAGDQGLAEGAQISQRTQRRGGVDLAQLEGLLLERLRQGHHGREDQGVEQRAQHEVLGERGHGRGDDGSQEWADDRHHAEEGGRAHGHGHERGAEDRDGSQSEGERQDRGEGAEHTHGHGARRGQGQAPQHEVDQRLSHRRDEVVLEAAHPGVGLEAGQQAGALESVLAQGLFEPLEGLALVVLGVLDPGDAALVLLGLGGLEIEEVLRGVAELEGDVLPEVAEDEGVEEVIGKAHEESEEVLVELQTPLEDAFPARGVGAVGQVAEAAPPFVLLVVEDIELLAVDLLEPVVDAEPVRDRALRPQAVLGCQGHDLGAGEAELPGDLVDDLGDVGIGREGLQGRIELDALDLAPAEEAFVDVVRQVGLGGLDCGRGGTVESGLAPGLGVGLGGLAFPGRGRALDRLLELLQSGDGGLLLDRGRGGGPNAIGDCVHVRGRDILRGDRRGDLGTDRSSGNSGDAEPGRGQDSPGDDAGHLGSDA